MHIESAVEDYDYMYFIEIDEEPNSIDKSGLFLSNQY